MKNKEQQAQEYAEKKDRAMRKAWYEYRFGEIDEGGDWENDPVRPSDNFGYAFNAGYTAAEQSMWRSVEDELPSNDDKVFVIIHGAYVCGWYDQKYELWEIFGMGSYNRKDASYWMPIPSIPDTKKREEMKTNEEYKAIVMEMAKVLSRHKLNTQEASYAAAMMFIGAVETDLEGYSESQKEAFCHGMIQNYFAEKTEV